MIIQCEPLGSDLKRIVLRLGGFHAEMSCRDCIGYIMASSGLQELLQLIYAPNAEREREREREREKERERERERERVYEHSGVLC